MTGQTELYDLAKRAFDVVASTLALAGLLPGMLLVAATIVLDSPGPALYRSKRVGKDGKEFTFYKFRTMYQNADSMLGELLESNEIEGGVIFKMTNDPRITRVGKFLRKYSIDELPQLFCVLKGDMSIIGPRPGTPREIALYDERAKRRLTVQQGMSGEWQAYHRNGTSFSEMIDCDLDYIDNKRSFLYDLKLITVTIKEVFSGNGR